VRALAASTQHGPAAGSAILSSVNHPPILLGTSSFTATGWQGSFYPKGLRPADYLNYYAQHFDTVEIDSAFYATPNVNVVRSWNAKTPEGLRISTANLCPSENETMRLLYVPVGTLLLAKSADSVCRCSSSMSSGTLSMETGCLLESLG
jgi:hypothetical protein